MNLKKKVKILTKKLILRLQKGKKLLENFSIEKNHLIRNKRPVFRVMMMKMKKN